MNRELVLLDWGMGRDILARQEEQGWGAKVIDRFAADICRTLPEMAGFSPRNLKYMRSFAAAWVEEEFVQQAAAQIPWFYNCVLLDKLKEPEERAWYVRITLEHDWNRSVLVHQVESGLFRCQGKTLTNFGAMLPDVQSDLA